ncbi:predicted protein [Sclerotinia sclerotiorum 1980 UF-70]|uniref:Uncharacterized protein n=1 Tax=Sclerotinia sclerotiorum (strain ATCC 18683 / 1980 / Ss-1) TaxID=665079 RepID=A7EQ88_SCLS1|nr:predicted protein [Sclerotinia sclerotiorum 1980 UF-70]EDO05004.1 predicted protein [Sclerotinia sclerotiorum 1980 UF-70]
MTCSFVLLGGQISLHIMHSIDKALKLDDHTKYLNSRDIFKHYGNIFVPGSGP